MSKGIMAGILAIGLLAGSAVANPYLLESWENDFSYWTNSADAFDSMGFSTSTGVTNGQYALKLDLKSGFQPGLQSAYEFDHFPALAGAQYVSVDVTTSASALNMQPGGSLGIGLLIAGRYNTGPGEDDWVGLAYLVEPGLLQQNTSLLVLFQEVVVAHATQLTTQTLTWDLTHGGEWNPIPEFDSPYGGWLQVAVRVWVEGANEGENFIYVDNLRVVPEPATLALLALGAAGMLRGRRG